MGNSSSEVKEDYLKSSEESKMLERGKQESFVKIRVGKRLSDSILIERERFQYFQKISSSKEKARKSVSSESNNNHNETINCSETNVKSSSHSVKSKTFQIPLQSTLRQFRSHIQLDFTTNFLKKLERKMTYDFENVSNKSEFEKTFYENISKHRHQSHDEGLPSEMEINLDKEDPKNSDTNNLDSSMCSSALNQSTLYDFELQLFKRGEDIRRSYINKLITTKIWQPSKKEKKHNTLIIFDWDDTLLCTSYLTPTGVFNEEFELSEKDKERIMKLENYVLKILDLAISKGDTYIITNAAPGWVEYSAERFYPDVFKILNKVTIVSARGEYEKLYPGDSRQWKIQAFLETKKNFDTDLVANIICLGDSIIEMEAAHVLASKFSQAFIKTIKFREAPKPEELIKQLGLVADQFSTIYSSVKNLTIRVERKGNKK